MNHSSSSKGQAFLALVIFIGGIVTVAGLLIAFFASSAVDTGYGVAASFTAESAATAGAEDALLQLDRNPEFPTGSGMSVPYTVTSGTATATVNVTQGSPSSGEATILSTATVNGRTKKINVVVSEDASTGAITIISWMDVQ